MKQEEGPDAANCVPGFKKKIKSVLCSQIENGLAPPRIMLSKKPVLRAHLEVGAGSMLTTLLTALPLTPTLAFREEGAHSHKAAQRSRLGICGNRCLISSLAP